MVYEQTVKSLVVTISIISLATGSIRLCAQTPGPPGFDAVQWDVEAARRRFETPYSLLGGPLIALIDTELASKIGDGMTNAEFAIAAKNWEAARDSYDANHRLLRANEDRIKRHPARWLALAESLMEKAFSSEDRAKLLPSMPDWNEGSLACPKLIMAASTLTNATSEKMNRRLAPLVVARIIQNAKFNIPLAFDEAIGPEFAKVMVQFLGAPEFYTTTNLFYSLDLLAYAHGIMGEISKEKDYMEQSWAVAPPYGEHKVKPLLRHAAFLAKSGAASDEVERGIQAAIDAYTSSREATFFPETKTVPVDGSRGLVVRYPTSAELEKMREDHLKLKGVFAEGAQYFWKLGLYDWAIILIKREASKNDATYYQPAILTLFPLLAERGMAEEMKSLLSLNGEDSHFPNQLYRDMAIGCYKAGDTNAAQDYLQRTEVIGQMEYWSAVAETEALRGRAQVAEGALRQCKALVSKSPEKLRGQAEWLLTFAYAKLALPEWPLPLKSRYDSLSVEVDRVQVSWVAGLACGRLGQLAAAEKWLLKLTGHSERMVFYAGVAKGLSEGNSILMARNSP